MAVSCLARTSMLGHERCACMKRTQVGWRKNHDDSCARSLAHLRHCELALREDRQLPLLVSSARPQPREGGGRKISEPKPSPVDSVVRTSVLACCLRSYRVNRPLMTVTSRLTSTRATRGQRKFVFGTARDFQSPTSPSYPLDLDFTLCLSHPAGSHARALILILSKDPGPGPPAVDASRLLFPRPPSRIRQGNGPAMVQQRTVSFIQGAIGMRTDMHLPQSRIATKGLIGCFRP
ncbi:hypothetical protein VTK73DRAFT_4921 [Phialemonium thermophilum]|uniref:Uncharacterized protein n=1 Tax=Phialemonium thermophilum TaxID=223376 RepID=A0ABR3WRL7_9PEZI